MGLARAIDRTPVLQRRRLDRDGQALVGSRCDDCETAVWPGRAVCHRCGSPSLQDVVFSRVGELTTMTQVHVARPGQATPYALGQVRLADGGPEVFGRVVDVPVDTVLPAQVEVAVGPGDDGTDTYWFVGLA